MNEWLNQVLATFSEYDLTYGGLAGSLFATIVVVALWRLATIGLSRYNRRHNIDAKFNRFIDTSLLVAAIILWLLLCLLSLNLNPVIWRSLTYANVLIAILLIIIARIADKLISARLLEEFESQTDRDIYRDQYGQKNKSNITGVVRNALLLIVSYILVTNSPFDYSLPISDDISLSISKVLIALFVILVARLLLWMVVNLFLYGWYKSEKVDLGKQYAYNQLLAYVVYFFGTIIALRFMSIDLTLLVAGAAALLVGVGIALQQVISDFFSGLVILFERSVEVGDFLDFGIYQGTVKKIGLRASVIETLERKDIIVPNSHLVNDRVANWSGTRMTTRFDVAVGVAYGTDTQLVKKILIQAAEETHNILKRPSPSVRFVDFGSSSLDFQLLFYTDKLRIFEDTKSELRFKIDELFRQHDLEIPFPQRDLWIRGGLDRVNDDDNRES